MNWQQPFVRKIIYLGGIVVLLLALIIELLVEATETVA